MMPRGNSEFLMGGGLEHPNYMHMHMHPLHNTG